MKKNYIFLILSIFLVFFTSCEDLCAKDLAQGFVNNRIPKKRLKVRKKPNTKSKTKFKLRENDLVIVTVSSGIWYKIRCSSGKGWVKKKYIAVFEIYSESDNKIKLDNKYVPKLNKSAGKNKVKRVTDDL